MAKRRAITASVSIAKPPEQVFAYVADVGRHGEWSPKPLRIADLSGPVAKGATFTSYGTIPGDKNHRNDVEVTDYEPPSRLALRSAEKDQHFFNTIEISAEGDGSKLTRTMDMPLPGGVLGVVFPLFVPVIRRDVQKGLNLLKQRLEQEG